MLPLIVPQAGGSLAPAVAVTGVDQTTVFGIGPANSDVIVRRGTHDIGTVTANGAGVWSLTPDRAPLNSDVYTARAAVTSAASVIRPFAGKVGVYASTSAGDVQRYASFLGRPLDFAECHSGRANAADYTGSVSYVIDQVQYAAEIAIAMPFFYEGGSLSAAAAGSYDAAWLQNAQTLLSKLGSQSQIVVRTGWEMNHSFQPWGVIDGSTLNAQKAADYITAWRRLVGIFRGVSNKFRFVWCINIGDYDPTPCYPGDAYVDFIGVDYYHNPQFGQPNTGPEAFAFMRTRSYGLDWFTAFADAHGKPKVVPEWGVSSAGFGEYIRAGVTWEREVGIVRTSWWDSNGAYQSLVSDGSLPYVGDMIRHMYSPIAHPDEPDVPSLTYGADYVTTQDLSDGGQWFTFGGMGVLASNRIKPSATSGRPQIYQSNYLPNGTYIWELELVRQSAGGDFGFNLWNGSNDQALTLTAAQITTGKRYRLELVCVYNGGSAHSWGISIDGASQGDFVVENLHLRAVTGQITGFNSTSETGNAYRKTQLT